MPDLTGIEKVDRLPILVSTMGDKKLLNIPKITEGLLKHRHKPCTVSSENGDWKTWYVPCALTLPAPTLADYQEHVPFSSSCWAILFYTSAVGIISLSWYWPQPSESVWDLAVGPRFSCSKALEDSGRPLT